MLDIKSNTEIWINGDEYTGYFISADDTHITIENYEMEVQVIPLSYVKRIKNRDTNKTISLNY